MAKTHMQGPAMAKRTFDILLSLAGLATFALPGLFFALLIWLEDRGPVFFIQERVGARGRNFRLIKFRSMKNVPEENTGLQWAASGDPRITKTGRWLRKTAMDELPQLFNILKGDMSFVGPRPERPQAVELLTLQIPGYNRRLEVRPGLTGLAQVHARYNTPDRLKLRFDILYARKHNLCLDALLVAKSVRISLLGRWDSTARKR